MIYLLITDIQQHDDEVELDSDVADLELCIHALLDSRSRYTSSHQPDQACHNYKIILGQKKARNIYKNYTHM